MVDPYPFFHSSHISPALISCIIQGQAQWSPQFRTCSVFQTTEYKWSIMINFIEDFILLGIMIWGVLRKRNATHLWNLLYLQGLFWVLTATLTELPSVVCRSCHCDNRGYTHLPYPGFEFPEH